MIKNYNFNYQITTLYSYQSDFRNDLQYLFPPDEGIKIFSTENLYTVSDILQRSYINDAVLNFQQFNEVQQLISDVWEFTSDSYMTTHKFSDKEYSIKDKETNDELYKYKQLLLDNNIPQENKPFQSAYTKIKCKILWVESTKQQTEIQNENNIVVTYFFNTFPNTYLIKPGDVIKDPVDPDDFWIVSQITEKHILYDKINQKNIKIYVLDITRLNLTTIPIQVWNHYFKNIEHLQFAKNEEQQRYEIISGQIPQTEVIIPDNSCPPEEEISEIPVTEIDVVKEMILHHKRRHQK